MDFLGGARYQKTVLNEQPRAYGFGVFAEVDGFGKAYKLIKQLDSYGLPFIRVQLMWKDDHNFKPSDVKAIENRSKKIASLNLKTKLYISPCCENNLNESQFEPFAQAVKKHLPKAEIVNSPNKGKGHVSKKYLNEYHHEEKPRTGGRYAFSFDGANCVDSDITKYKANYQQAEYFMLWNSQCNGRRNITDGTAREQRKYWPTDKQIDSWVWLTRDKGATQARKGDILKSHSDQHTQPASGKDQKPVYIIKEKVKEIVLKADNGQTIDTLRYYGSFSGGGHRYYATQWGFELAQKAIRIHGKPTCNYFINGKKAGVVNPAFRDGVYR
jgi:hypothetical protein